MKWSVWFLLASVLIASSAQAALDSASPPPPGDVQVARVTPEGANVPAARQIVVTFDRPMTPIGDMLLTADKAPVSIEPEVKCHWHWLDPRSLACELDAHDATSAKSWYEWPSRRNE